MTYALVVEANYWITQLNVNSSQKISDLSRDHSKLIWWCPVKNCHFYLGLS